MHPDYAVSPVPAETTTPASISDLIGDDYKTWDHGRVLIDAACNTGKTHFILSTLVAWLISRDDPQHHKLLYLCNRTSLKNEVSDRRVRLFQPTPLQQEEIDLGISTIKDFLPDRWHSVCVLETYQWLEYFCKNDRDNLIRYLSNFQYIVADECHYFHCDAAFNEHTDISKRLLDELASQKVIIYMSATADFLFRQLRADTEHLIHFYQMTKPYQISKIHSYCSIVQRRDILDTLPEGEKALVFVKSRDDLVAMQNQYGPSAGYYCSKGNLDGPMDPLEDCVVNGILQKKILFCTTALYNGVDIKDPSLKHILVELWDPTDVEQAIGRKRPIDPNDSFQLYMKVPSKKELCNQRKTILAPLQAAILYKSRKNSQDNLNKWVAYTKTPKAQKEIQQIMVETRDEAQEKFHYELLQMRFEKWMEQQKVLNEMIDDTFLHALIQRIPSIDPSTPQTEYLLSSMVDFIQQNINRAYPLKELKRLLIQHGQISAPGRSKSRGIGPTIINQFLAPYHVKLVSYQNWCGEHRGESFGKIVDLSA